MAVAVNGWDGNAFDQNSIDAVASRFLKTLCRLTLSGNYTTGGDTLDFSNGGVNSAVPPNSRGISQVSIKSNGPAASVGANGGNYQFIPGSGASPWTNAKLKVFATAGTQYASGAYGSDATTDIVECEVWWAR